MTKDNASSNDKKYDDLGFAAARSRDETGADSDASEFSSVDASSSPSGNASDEFRTLGRYRILDVLGRGGMGRVSLAYDDEMERSLAVKEMAKRLRSDDVYRRRFVLEAKITGYLNHPGVVPVYELAFDSKGAPYYTMRRIEGVSFERSIKEYVAAPEPAKLKDLVRRLIFACRTVAYAHSVGVIHRDIKPSNIMVCDFDATFVTDWGLARPYGAFRNSRVTNNGKTIPPTKNFGRLDDLYAESERGAAESRSRVGTRWFRDPDYIKTGLSRPYNDQFAFGVVLYYILAGKLPFYSDELSEKAAVATLKADFPRGANAPKPLAFVCMKAIEKKPEKRYASLAEFADDMRRWLEGEPVVARKKWFA